MGDTVQAAANPPNGSGGIPPNGAGGGNPPNGAGGGNHPITYSTSESLEQILSHEEFFIIKMRSREWVHVEGIRTPAPNRAGLAGQGMGTHCLGGIIARYNILIVPPGRGIPMGRIDPSVPPWVGGGIGSGLPDVPGPVWRS